MTNEFNGLGTVFIIIDEQAVPVDPIECELTDMCMPCQCFIEEEEIEVDEKDLARAIAHTIGGFAGTENMQQMADKIAAGVFDFLEEKGVIVAEDDENE